MREAIERFRNREPEDRAARRRDVRVLILTGLGLNCEAETAAAFEMVGARPERHHLLEFLEPDSTARRDRGSDIRP